MENLTPEYRRGLSEVEVIINNLDPQSQNKIPQQFKDFIHNCKLQDYSPIFDPTKPLTAQNFSKEAFSILAVVQYNYLCDTKEAKDKFLNSFKN